MTGRRGRDEATSSEGGATPPVALSARILDAMSDGVYYLDQDRRIRVWNTGAATISGYDAEHVVGRACSDNLLNHVDEEGRPLCGARCPVAATMDDGVDRRTRVFLRHRDGQLVPVVVHASAVRDADGRIVGAVESFRDDTAHVTTTRRVAELETLTMRDPLTGVGNRRYMDHVLDQRCSAHEREGAGFAVLLLDLDRFKSVNDTHGHDVGDRVLRATATTLVGAVRGHDDVTRFGGEEFLILSDQIDPAALWALAHRLTTLVRRARHRVDGTTFSITASIGATVARPTDTPASILHRADQALLAAKRAGRNRVSIA